ncbi:MAG TPA: SAM-dependent methyltransferase [Streptosporangiaceae bacterium]|jgi:hypothetical protein
MRTKAETERFFDGLDLIDPGVTPVTHWHPDRPVDPDDPVHHMYAGLMTSQGCARVHRHM